LKRYEEATSAYEAGLAVAPSDAGLKNGLEEVRKAKATANAPRGAGGGGGLFPPAFLAKLAGHPKYGPKLADPVFQAKLQMLQSNPQLMIQDPEIMEIFSLLIGGEKDGGDYNEPPPFRPSASSPSPAPAPASSAKPSAPMDVEEDSSSLSEEEKVLKDKKKAALAAKERGNTLYKAKNFQEAIEAYDEAIALDPNNILFISNKAAVYIEMGDPDRAIQLCDQAIETGRAHRASYEDIAKVYQRQAAAALKKDDIELAISYYGKSQMEAFDKAIERKVKNLELDLKKKKAQDYIDPELGLQAKEKGNAAFREGNFPEAIKEYEEAIKRDPKNASYYNNLAAALLKVGDFNGAKIKVEKSLELDPKYVKAWAKKGDIEFFMKEYHRAMDSYRAGLKLEPDNTLCSQGLSKTISKINESSGDADAGERQAHALADPEIQMILQDPIMRQLLQDLQENPQYGQQALRDPVVRAKFEKLVAAGVLQIK